MASRARGRGRHREGKPSLKAVVRNQFATWTSPWTRLDDAKWLGPYTPTAIPHWVRKLMRRDAQISLGLGALKSPFFGIEYRLGPGGHADVRAFLQRVLLDSPIFQQLVWSCLNSLDFGYQTHELLWALHDVAIDADGAGGAPPRVMPGAYVLRRIRDLDPDKVELLVDAFDELAGVRFVGAPTGITISADKVLHAVHQHEFDNLRGESILDRAYQFWHFCNVQYLLLNRYLEGRGNPPLIGTAPNEARYDEDKPRDGQTPKHCLDVLNEQMVSLRSGGACALPYEVDGEGNPKWGIKVLEDGGRTETFLGAINHYNGMKLRALYVPERIATQDTATGSFAMVKEHVDVFFGMLEVIKKRTVLAPINEIAALLVRANFGRSATVPPIDASELSRFKSELLGEVVKQIITLPTRAPDGSVFTGSEWIDVPRTLDAANVPRVSSRELARRKPAAPPTAPPSSSAPPTPRPPAPAAPPAEPKPNPSEAALARLAERVIDFQGELAASPPPPAAPINLNVSVQPAQANVTLDVQPAAPDVHVHNDVQPAAAPDVHLHAEIAAPAMKAPVVNLAPVIQAAPAPAMNIVVNTPPQASAAGKSVVFKTDQHGRITGADVTPTGPTAD